MGSDSFLMPGASFLKSGVGFKFVGKIRMHIMKASDDSKAPFFIDNEVITLTRGGVWLSDQTEIDHEQTVRLFGRSLKKDGEGYFIQVGRETKRIVVQDTAYFVTRLEGDATQGYRLWLSDGTQEDLDPDTLSYRPGRLTCRVHGGSEEARLLSVAYFDLLKDLQEDNSNNGAYFLSIRGKRVELAKK
jgi:hypothetical protein